MAKSSSSNDSPSQKKRTVDLSIDLGKSDEIDISSNIVDIYSKTYVIIYCLMAVMPGIIFSIGIGYSAHMNTIVINNNYLQHEDLSLYSSILTIGAMFGSLFSGFFTMDMIGRKYTILTSAIIAFIGFAMHLILLNPNAINHIDLRGFLVGSRIVMGAGIGMGLVAAPVYVAEVSPSTLFHYTAVFYQIYIGLGFVILNLTFFATDRLDVQAEKLKTDYYHGRLWTPIVAMAVCTVQAIFSLIIPHSPAWLLSKKKYLKKDGKAIRENNIKLYSSEYNFKQLMHMTRRAATNKQSKINLAAFFRPLTLKVLLIAAIAMFYQQFSGINPILFNASIIFSNAGLKQETLGLVILGLAHFGGAIIGVVINVYVGKKLILVVTSSVIGVVHLIFGLHTRYLVSNPNLSWLPVFLLVIFLILFNIGWGPIPFIINSIFFPAETTNLGSGIGIMLNWVFGFIISYPYFIMQDSFGLDGVFFFFSIIMFSAAVVSAILIPEFKGKTKDQILEAIDRSLINTDFK